ncbi:MAG: glycosyltransferase family A protein [Planctomycetota bacterium]
MSSATLESNSSALETHAQLLTWSLVVATYNRAAVLPECLRLAAEQSVPPKEIIVVDASVDWQGTREVVWRDLRPRHPAIAWTYVAAEEASSATQRNQGIALATGDLVLFTDDDCLLYPDAMEHVRRVFEADRDREVAAVHMIFAPPPPDSIFAQAGAREDALAGKNKPRFALAQLVRKVLSCDDLFVPYDADFPVRQLPPAVAQLNVAVRKALPGGGLVVRRTLLDREQFCPLLKRYASGEDTDLTYRL